jgi:Outer membrane protein beta-barrel domain
MQKTHFRNQFHIFWQKSLLVIFLIVLSYNTLSAQWINRNRSRYTEDVGQALNRSKDRLTRPLHFGFQLALSRNTSKIRFSDSYNQGIGTNGLINIQPKASLGFTIGAYSSIRLSDFWDARICVNVFAASERQIEYVFTDKVEPKIIEASMIELPLLLKYRAQIRGISGMYLIAGVKPSFALSQKSKDRDNIVLNKSDLTIEYGLGLDVFFPFFRFAPELRFSHGISNVLKENRENFYSNQLRRINTHSATLYFHFGG